MPMDRSRYPANWPEISRRIRFERANGKCEQCGAPHGEWIVRVRGTDRWMLVDELYATNASYAMSLGYEGDEPEVRVVLTVHHIGAPHPDGRPGDKHDKMDCRDANLIALCQRCHLLADLPDHLRRAAETRRRKWLQQTGQLEMELVA